MCDIPEATTRNVHGPFVIVLDRGHYTTCAINLRGATITSWRVENVEQLFASECGVIDGKKIIRGGIEIAFPHYGLWKLGPRNGFARNCLWKVKEYPRRLPETDDIQASFSLTDDVITHSMWNYEFELTNQVTLGKYGLTVKITVANPSKYISMYFDVLLHNYLLVPDIARCAVMGLKNSMYRDCRRQDAELVRETRDEIVFDRCTDCLYQDTYYDEHTLTNVVDERNLIIRKHNLPETVLWNPWKTIAMTDFEPEEYAETVCIMPGYVAHSVVVLPEDSYEAVQVLRLNIYEPEVHFY